MRATCTRLVLGCLLASLLALPALASIRTVRTAPLAEEEAYAVLKQSVVDQVEDGRLSEEAMGLFLEALRHSQADLVELDAKDAEAPAERVRTLLVELNISLAKNDNDSLVQAAVRWTRELTASDALRLRRTSDRR